MDIAIDNIPYVHIWVYYLKLLIILYMNEMEVITVLYEYILFEYYSNTYYTRP